jgi:HK97 gp10 family phage protein
MAKGTSISTSNFVVDATGLRALAADLRTVSPELYTAFRARTKAAGMLVAAEAKRRSSWSTRIPGSIKVSITNLGTGIKVTANGAKAPDAAPYENKGQSGNFRHPVFGNTDVWVSQKARPFLAPAAEAKAEEVTEAFAEAVDDAFVEHGWI